MVVPLEHLLVELEPYIVLCKCNDLTRVRWAIDARGSIRWRRSPPGLGFTPSTYGLYGQYIEMRAGVDCVVWQRGSRAHARIANNLTECVWQSMS